MLVVALVSFSLFNFVGDPINNMVGEETSDEEREELRESLGLNDGIYVQFSRFIINASKGEFGISYQLRRPVSDLIIERLPATIELVVVSALIALISGTLLGVYTGINRKGFFSDIILAISLIEKKIGRITCTYVTIRVVDYSFIITKLISFNAC